MKKIFLLLFIAGLLLCSCLTQEENPFFSEFDTPFQVPPFDKIQEEHYLPAFKEGMEQQNMEIEVIINNPEAPTFENTIEAMEGTGSLLRKVGSVFGVLNGSMTNENMQKIAKEVAPLRSKHRDNIRLNDKLFQRIKAVYEQKDKLDLTTEQNTLLVKYYKDFVRSGANLDEEKKAKLKEINQELSILTVKFGENVLKENNRFEMVIDKKEDLAGLPQAAIIGAAEAAKERGHEGKWVFTIHKPSMIPFLQYSEKRDLREKIFKDT